MMRADILQNLFAQRDTVSDMIIDLSPNNDSERDQLHTLMQRRDRITGAINQVIAVKFNETAAGLADKVSDLEKKTDQLNKLSKTIGNVNTAIQIADQIIKEATSILALAVSL